MKIIIRIIKDKDRISGGLADKLKGSMEEKHQQLADMHGVTLDEIEEELALGIEIELEHTDDEDIAHEIAMDHIFEDAEYYTKLSQAELEEAKKKKRKKKKDACYKKVKARYKIWPSAYASGALVKCRKVGAKNWGNKSKKKKKKGKK